MLGFLTPPVIAASAAPTVVDPRLAGAFHRWSAIDFLDATPVLAIGDSRTGGGDVTAALQGGTGPNWTSAFALLGHLTYSSTDRMLANVAGNHEDAIIQLRGNSFRADETLLQRGPAASYDWRFRKCATAPASATSRQFTNDPAEILNAGNALATLNDVTIGIWFYPTATPNNNDTLMAIARAGEFSHYIAIRIDADLTIQGTVDDPTNVNTSNTTNAATLNAWNYALMRVRAAEFDITLNGDVGGRQTQAYAPNVTGTDRISIGGLGIATAQQAFEGRLSYPSIYNTSLSDANITLLAGGEDARNVAAGNLVHYWPDFSTAPIVDVVNARNLTVPASAPAVVNDAPAISGGGSGTTSLVGANRSRNFTKDAAQTLIAAGLARSSPSLTIGIWFNLNAAPTSGDTMLSIANSASQENFFALRTQVGGNLRGTIDDGVQFHTNTINAATPGTWHLAIARIRPGEIQIVLDADFSNSRTNPHNWTLNTLDQITIGARGGATPSQPIDAKLAFPFIAGVELTDAQITSLFNKADIRNVIDENILHYWPDIGGDPVNDVTGSANLIVPASAPAIDASNPAVVLTSSGGAGAECWSLEVRLTNGDLLDLQWPYVPTFVDYRFKLRDSAIEVVGADGTVLASAVPAVALQRASGAIQFGICDSTTAPQAVPESEQPIITEVLLFDAGTAEATISDAYDSVAARLDPVVTDLSASVTVNEDRLIDLGENVEAYEQGFSIGDVTVPGGDVVEAFGIGEDLSVIVEIAGSFGITAPISGGHARFLRTPVALAVVLNASTTTGGGGGSSGAITVLAARIPLPPQTGEVVVNPSTFKSAVESVPAGTHVLLEAGTGPFDNISVSSRNGTEEFPIVVRPQDPDDLQSKFTRQIATYIPNVSNTGSRNLHFFGCRFEYLAGAAGPRALRCSNTRNITVAYCDFHASGYGIEFIGSTIDSCLITHCFFKPQPISSGNGQGAVKLGGGGLYKTNANSIMQWCRLEDYRYLREAISIKTGFWEIANIHLHNCNDVALRYAAFCILREILCTGTLGNGRIQVAGEGNSIINCNVRDILVQSGNVDGSLANPDLTPNAPNTNRRPNAIDTLLANNTVSLQLEYGDRPFNDAQNGRFLDLRATIRNTTGNIVNGGFASGAQIFSGVDPQYPVLAAPSIPATDVGIPAYKSLLGI